MKGGKVWRDEYVEIKAYLSTHTKAEAMRCFERGQGIVKMIDISNSYEEFTKFRRNRRHWQKPFSELPKPDSWHKKTPIEKFNDEWYFEEEKNETTK